MTAGLFAYSVCIPWILPSTVWTTQANTQSMQSENAFGARHLILTATLMVLCVGWLWLSARMRGRRAIRFFGLAFLIPAFIVLGSYWGNLTVIAQPHRFHLAMEMCLCALAGCLLNSITTRVPASRGVVYMLAVPLLVWQAIRYQRYAETLIQPIKISKTTQFTAAEWLARHSAGERVMIPGSGAFWLNALADVPQISGCCEQSPLSHSNGIAKYMFESDQAAGTNAAKISETWLEALGAGIAVIFLPESTEPYAMVHPLKFQGRLKELWHGRGAIIYQLPSAGRGIAHLVYPAELPQRMPVNGIDTGPLMPYVKSVLDSSRPLVQAVWKSADSLMLCSVAARGQLVSVNIPAHPGWHARVDGVAVPIQSDKLGQLLINPKRNGKFRILLTYDGGTEAQVCGWIPLPAIGIWAGFAFVSTRKRRGVQRAATRRVF